jgi:peptidylprolyl isomerase
MSIVSKIIAVVLAIALLFFVFQRFYNNKDVAVENIQIGEDFLTQNKKVDGVQVTNTGLQYLVLVAGEGTIKPTANDQVKVHYHGTLIDGTVFDSSIDRGQPLEFGLNQVIAGWTEGLQLMVVGEKTRLFIPSELAYGNSTTGKIKPGSTLIFDVELLAITQ